MLPCLTAKAPPLLGGQAFHPDWNRQEWRWQSCLHYSAGQKAWTGTLLHGRVAGLSYRFEQLSQYWPWFQLWMPRVCWSSLKETTSRLSSKLAWTSEYRVKALKKGAHNWFPSKSPNATMRPIDLSSPNVPALMSAFPLNRLSANGQKADAGESCSSVDSSSTTVGGSCFMTFTKLHKRRVPQHSFGKQQWTHCSTTSN